MIPINLELLTTLLVAAVATPLLLGLLRRIPKSFQTKERRKLWVHIPIILILLYAPLLLPYPPNDIGRLLARVLGGAFVLFGLLDLSFVVAFEVVRMFIGQETADSWPARLATTTRVVIPAVSCLSGIRLMVSAG